MFDLTKYRSPKWWIDFRPLPCPGRPLTLRVMLSCGSKSAPLYDGAYRLLQSNDRCQWRTRPWLGELDRPCRLADHQRLWYLLPDKATLFVLDEEG